MMSVLQHLIEALRNELQQYGEILALLDHQKEIVLLRGADEILHSISAINAQSATIQAAREKRGVSQRRLSEALGQPADSTFVKLVPLVPEQYRPLVTALVQENNELLLRVRQRAEQNHLLLEHSVDLMHRFITTLSPQDPSSQANGEGTKRSVGQDRSSLYDAIA